MEELIKQIQFSKPLIWGSAIVHVLFHLSFFYFIGPVLRRQDNREISEVEQDRYESFKSKARFFLYGGTITFCLAVVISANTLTVHPPYPILLVGGGLLVLLGLIVRYLAYSVIGEKGYYCYNFFKPPEKTTYKPESVYKYLDNPMYSFGYLPAFGLPLVFLSLHGIVLAIVDWGIICSFYYIFEHRHTEEVVRDDTESQEQETEEEYRKAV